MTPTTQGSDPEKMTTAETTPWQGREVSVDTLDGRESICVIRFRTQAHSLKTVTSLNKESRLLKFHFS